MREHSVSLGEVIAGRFRVQVIDARAVRRRDFIWIDLKILGGPEDGRCVTVGAHVPDETASSDVKSAFLTKMRGLLPAIWAAKALKQPEDKVIEAIATAIRGEIIEADLSIQSDGKFDATVRLDATRAAP
jgi:hypothetical protein